MLAFMRILSLIAVTLASSPAPAADIQKSVTQEGLVIISLTGDIELQDDQKFIQLADGVANGVVTLHSDGGSLIPAIAIGRAIRAQGLITAVADHSVCASACAIIWLGGTKRIASSSAQIGFHAAYRQRFGITSESGSGNAIVGSYYASLGLSDEAIYYLTSSAPSDMFWIDADKARSLGIDITIVPSETTAEVTPPATYGFGYWFLRLPSSVINAIIQ